MKSLILQVLLLLIAITLNATSQAVPTDKPVIGKPCPTFTLKNIKYYYKTNVTLTDFKGKWLVLDFWNKNCVACVRSFPKTNELKKEFEDSVEFILVGRQDKENQIETIYDKFRNKMSLELPCSFDSTLSIRWEYYANPILVIVDPNGIVRAVTVSINSYNLKKLMRGEPVTLLRSEDKKYNTEKPFLVDNNASSDSNFIFRSLISVWNPAIPFYNQTIEQSLKKGRFEILGSSLTRLYKIAYIGDVYWTFTPSFAYQDTLYGRYYLEPIVDVENKTNFEIDESTGDVKLFCYSQTLPKERATVESVRLTMQNDLQNCFGYRARIENKKMPYWKLTAAKEYKESLKSEHSIRSITQTHIQFIGQNIPVSILLGHIAAKNQPNLLPFIDETGIDFNIDIELNCIFNDLNDVIRELQKKGLNLEKGEKEMKVLVISDN